MAMHHPTLLQVALVVLLRLPERRRRFHLGRDLLPIRPRGVKLRDLILRLLHLLIRVRKHHAAVLRAPVRPLPIHLGRIVQREERVQQCVVRHSPRIERYVDHLGVSGAIGAYLLIRRVLQVSALVSHRRIDHPRDLCETGFYAPKTSSSKCCLFNRHFALLLCSTVASLLFNEFSSPPFLCLCSSFLCL